MALGVLEEDEGVGHAGDVVRYGAGETFGLDLFEVGRGQLFGTFDPVVEEGGDYLFSLAVLVVEDGAGVEGVVEVALFLEALGLGLRGEGGEADGVVACILEAGGADGAGVLEGGADEVVGEGVLHELQGLVEEVLLVDSGVLAGYGAVAASEDGYVVADMGDLEQAGLYAVVEVGGEVGDFIGEVDELSFEGWTLSQKVGGEFGVPIGAVVAGVLDDAFADAEGEVEAAVGGVALLEVLDDAEGVEIVVEEAAVALEALVESALTGVAERRVADVVDQGEGLGEVLVEAEAGGNGAGDLGDLDGVGEAGAEVVGGAAGEDLGLAGETAEGSGLDNALAVTLERCAACAVRRGVDAGEERVAEVAGDGAVTQGLVGD